MTSHQHLPGSGRLDEADGEQFAELIAVYVNLTQQIKGHERILDEPNTPADILRIKDYIIALKKLRERVSESMADTVGRSVR